MCDKSIGVNNCRVSHMKQKNKKVLRRCPKERAEEALVCSNICILGAASTF